MTSNYFGRKLRLFGLLHSDYNKQFVFVFAERKTKYLVFLESPTSSQYQNFFWVKKENTIPTNFFDQIIQTLYKYKDNIKFNAWCREVIKQKLLHRFISQFRHDQQLLICAMFLIGSFEWTTKGNWFVDWINQDHDDTINFAGDLCCYQLILICLVITGIASKKQIRELVRLVLIPSPIEKEYICNKYNISLFDMISFAKWLTLEKIWAPILGLSESTFFSASNINYTKLNDQVGLGFELLVIDLKQNVVWNSPRSPEHAFFTYVMETNELLIVEINFVTGFNNHVVCNLFSQTQMGKRNKDIRYRNLQGDLSTLLSKFI